MAPTHALPAKVHLLKRIPCTADLQCGTANATLNEIARACGTDGNCAVTCATGYTACAYNWCSNDPAGCAAATPLPGQGPGYNADGSPVVAAPTSPTPSPTPTASLEASSPSSAAMDPSPSLSTPADSSSSSPSAIPTSTDPAVVTSQQPPSPTTSPSQSSSATGTPSAQVAAAAAALGATSTSTATAKPDTSEPFHLSFTLIFGIVLAIGVAVTAAVFIYFRVRATRRARAAAAREKLETAHRREMEAQEMERYSHFGPGGTLVSPSTLKRRPVEAPRVPSSYGAGTWEDPAALEGLAVRHGAFDADGSTPASGMPETDVGGGGGEWVPMVGQAGSGSLQRGRPRGDHRPVDEYDVGEDEHDWAAQHAQAQNYAMQGTYLLDNPPSADAEFQWRG